MLDLESARQILYQNLPEASIHKAVEYKNLFIFLMIIEDSLEGSFDPFFSVNRETKEFRDFALFAEEDPIYIISLFDN